jgi:hypothetical protein
MGQNTFLTGEKYLQKCVVNKNVSHCRIESGGAAHISPQKLSLCQKKRAAGNEIQAQAGADKAAASGECIVRLEIRCGEPNQIVCAEIELHAVRERESERVAFFRPPKRKKILLSPSHA